MQSDIRSFYSNDKYIVENLKSGILSTDAPLSIYKRR
jgi:hypothetical protein